MSDFSLFSLFTAGLACLVPLTAAYTKPVGASPEGNPISQPGLNSVVPAGEGFTVTWEPTTKGTVTLVLLKGPSDNAVPQYAIAEKIENDGEYAWTPSTDLAPSDPSTPAQGYGIQLIDDATGQYQYTTQFGISNPDYKKSSSSSSSKAPSYSTTKKGEAPYPTTVVDHYTVFTTYCPESTTIVYHNQTYTTSGTVKITPTGYAPPPKATGASSYVSTSPVANVTMVAPTGYAPSTIKTSAASTSPIASATYEGSPAQQTGAASNVAMSVFGLVAAAGVAVLAI